MESNSTHSRTAPLCHEQHISNGLSQNAKRRSSETSLTSCNDDLNFYVFGKFSLKNCLVQRLYLHLREKSSPQLIFLLQETPILLLVLWPNLILLGIQLGIIICIYKIDSSRMSCKLSFPVIYLRHQPTISFPVDMPNQQPATRPGTGRLSPS